ncbi:MAG: apolipoprotein N-acyltransferase [Bacteroidia bacterium]|nr:apolipoprotein N-acyltransferase [Bacteroidia bacterium]NNC86561.1 apolipoprotein N-acyltransferase [Bacteroidia bacterium]NNM15345.1 apolipoprotein N-acyltransferase [Bacteroidia bacterium]
MRKKFLFLSILSGLLFSVAWPSMGFPILLFWSFIPLLIIEEEFSKAERRNNRFSVFAYSYLAFFIWNILTTWWVYFASPFGAAAAIICNALFMALVFHFYHLVKKHKGVTWGYLSLISFWVTFELFHLNWDLSWPWLTLGNGFASFPKLVQWYEYTGVLGGTLWIILINLLLFHLLFKLERNFTPVFKQTLLAMGICLAVPIVFSLIRYYSYEDEGEDIKIAVVQPNIDPYSEKFSASTAKYQIDKILELSESVTDSATRFILAPETAVPSSVWDKNIQQNIYLRQMKTFVEQYPDLTYITGISYYKFYEGGKNETVTARKFANADDSYDAFNTAVQIDRAYELPLHHKSKLVPGVEKMPYPAIFGFLEKFAIDLGGTSGTLASLKHPTVFFTDDSLGVAPIICYESIYGEYVAKYVNSGANLLFIITNDGWWGNTPGYKQHMQYARLRAIEFRKSVARSANTGISGFINQRGDILDKTEWWQPDARNHVLKANEKFTFYAKMGDLIGKISMFVSLMIVLKVVMDGMKSRFPQKELENE